MKKTSLLLLLVCLLFACQKEDEMPPEETNTVPPPSIEIEPVESNGEIALPGSIANLNNLKVVSGFYEGTVAFNTGANQVTGTWDILLNQGNSQLVTLLNDDEVLAYTIAIPEVSATLEFNEESTAASLVLMHPLMISSDPALVPDILTDIKSASTFAALANEVEAGMSDGALEIPDISVLVNQVVVEVANSWAGNIVIPTQNGIELTNLEKDPSLSLKIVNSRKRWLTVYAEKITNGTAEATNLSYQTGLLSASQEVDHYVMPSGNLSIFNLFQLSEISPTLRMDTEGAESLLLKCYGLGLEKFPSNDATALNRGMEAVAYTATFDFVIPIVELISGVKGIGTELRGRPNNEPLKKIIQLLIDELKSPNRILQFQTAVDNDNAKDFVMIFLDAAFKVATNSDNEKVIFDLLKQFNFEKSLAAAIIKKFLFPLQLYAIFEVSVDLSAAIFSAYTSDWTTEFDINLGETPDRTLVGIQSFSKTLSSYDFGTGEYTELINELPNELRWFESENQFNKITWKHQFRTGNDEYLFYNLPNVLGQQQVLYEVNLQTLATAEYTCPNLSLQSIFYNEAENSHYFIGREIDTSYPNNSGVYKVALHRLNRLDCSIDKIELETVNGYRVPVNISYSWNAKYFPGYNLLFYWAGRENIWNEAVLGPQPTEGTYVIDLQTKTEQHFSTKNYNNLFEHEGSFYYIGYFDHPFEECAGLPDLIRLDIVTKEETLVTQDISKNCGRAESWGRELSSTVSLFTYPNGGNIINSLIIENELHVSGPAGHSIIDMNTYELLIYDEDGPNFDYIHHGY